MRPTATPPGRNKPIGQRSLAIGDAAKPPTALGHESQNARSTDGAKETPSAWRRVRIGDTLRLVNGTAFKPTDWTPDGLPIVRIQNLNNPDAAYNRFNGVLPDKFRLRGGELLFAWSGTPGTSFGAHIWRGGDAWLNQHIFNVLFDESEWDKRFLQLAINQNLAAYIRAAHGGAGLAHITKGRFGESELLQPPVPNQRRIVAEIEKQLTRLEAGVAALRRVQANLKRYRAAVLKAACEGKLVPTEAELARVGRVPSRGAARAKTAGSGDPAYNDAGYETGEELLQRILAERRKNWTGRGKYKEPAVPDTANLPPLPKGWTWASLEQVSRESSYGTSAKCSYDNSGPPVLRIPNIAARRIDLSDLKFAAVSEHIEAGDELVPGDLLIIRTNGSKNLIGRSAVVREALNRSTSYASYLIRFRLSGSPALFDWVGTIWDASFLRAWIEQRAATSAGQHNISMSVLSTMPVPIPPSAEQTRIVAEVERRLSVVEELEAVVSANLERVIRLRQSILQKAFQGELCS